MTGRPIAVAVSGGIDSLVAAHLLKQSGHTVFGLHFTTGFEPLPESGLSHIQEQLGIPVHTVDLSAAFQRKVVDYFTRTYAAGRTPNPCLACNPAIKFGDLLESARSKGAEYLATGHYARIIRDANGRHRLLRGIDPQKDQSYFLAFLNQEQLAAARFPLGEMTKDQVRETARVRGLTPARRKESQDVCFIPKDYAAFLTDQPGFGFEPGPIEDLCGNRLGEHPGLHRFTVGQRRGINCPAAQPYYVVRLDPPRNRLVVGGREDLLSSECRVSVVNWIMPIPDSPLRTAVRVRYRHTAVPAVVHPGAEGTARVVFDTPEPAVTPGQGAVFYEEEAVLGGGWIEDTKMNASDHEDF
ncbi:MAG: tRNA 2-thiouridine(34) synthase MnmA [Desulfococcaceae bacterium]